MRAAKALGFAWLLVATGLGQWACRDGVAPEPTLTIAIRGDVTGFFPNPPVSNELFTICINRSIFEPLVGFDGQLRLQPRLAESWETPDNRTYIFRLRRGVRFSDGRLMTAEDVAASLRAIVERGWVAGGNLESIQSVKALSPYVVEVRTATPNLSLLARLPYGLVLPAAVLDQKPVPNVGTGPYRLERWEPGREFVMTRNPRYWGSRPRFERVRFEVVPDDQARMARVEAGEAQVADGVPFSALARLTARSDLRVVVRRSLRVLFLGLRVTEPPFSDPRVREAVDLAIDRKELIERALEGRGEPATQLVPPEIIGFNPAIPPPRVDRARSRALLAAAGHPNGFAIRLDGPNNRYGNDVGILQEVARQLATIGIRAEVHAEDKGPYFERLERGDSQMHLVGWLCESGDAGDALDSILRSRTSLTLGRLNTTGESDPELDRLMDAAHGAETLKERADYLQQALARASNLRVTLPLLVPTEAIVTTRRLGWEPPLTLALNPEQMYPAP